MDRDRQNGAPAPWWAKLPTTKLLVVGGFAFLLKYGDRLIEAAVRACR